MTQVDLKVIRYLEDKNFPQIWFQSWDVDCPPHVTEVFVKEVENRLKPFSDRVSEDNTDELDWEDMEWAPNDFKILQGRNLYEIQLMIGPAYARNQVTEEFLTQSYVNEISFVAINLVEEITYHLADKVLYEDPRVEMVEDEIDEESDAWSAWVSLKNHLLEEIQDNRFPVKGYGV